MQQQLTSEARNIVVQAIIEVMCKFGREKQSAGKA